MLVLLFFTVRLLYLRRGIRVLPYRRGIIMYRAVFIDNIVVQYLCHCSSVFIEMIVRNRECAVHIILEWDFFSMQGFVALGLHD